MKNEQLADAGKSRAVGWAENPFDSVFRRLSI